MAELDAEGKQVVNRVKELLQRTAVLPELNARFDWGKAKPDPEENGIRVPGLPTGSADAVIVPSAAINNAAPGMMQAGANITAFSDLKKNILVIPDPTTAYFQNRKAIEDVAYNAPKNAQEGIMYRPLLPATSETLELKYKASVGHEVCHLDREPSFLLSAKNSEVTCVSFELSVLSKAGYARDKDKKTVINNLGASIAATNWSSEVLILTDGTFDKSAREILPGHPLFNSAVQARIELFKYQSKLKTPEGEVDPKLKDLIDGRQVLIDSPKDNVLITTLIRYMSIELEREFDSKLERNLLGDSPPKQEDYVTKRLSEFKAYLNGDKDTFKLERFFATPK